MRAGERFQMTVETPSERVRLIRVAGGLDQATAAALLRMIDAQLESIAARRRSVTDLLVDLEGVSNFEPAAVKAMRHARRSTAARGVRLHLTGCTSRFFLLPLSVRRLLAEFRAYPTVEVALAALARPAAVAADPGPAPSAPSSTGRHEPPTAQPHDGPGVLGEPPIWAPARGGWPHVPAPRSIPGEQHRRDALGTVGLDAIR